MTIFTVRWKAAVQMYRRLWYMQDNGDLFILLFELP